MSKNKTNKKPVVKNDLPWWRDEPFIDGPGLQEAIAHRLRRGCCSEDVFEQYDYAFSDENAERVAAEGHTFIETTFFKGFGIEYERAGWERSRDYLAKLRQKGLRTGVYTQWGSFFTETFFQEYPQAREWVQMDINGRPIEYGDPPNQYWRWRGCPGNQDFVDFMKKLVQIAVEEIKVDVVYFDNMCIFEGHDTLCYCECCRQGFRKFLDARYPGPEALFNRMGLRNTQDIEIPRFRPWSDNTLINAPIIDPLKQELIEFRCRQFADAWHQVYEYLQSLNPDCALMGNPSFPRKYNEQLTSAIDMWLLRKTPGPFYMENAVRDVGVREGVVVSNIRGYKYGRALGSHVMVCCGYEQEPALSYCEGLAFQNGSGGKMNEVARPYRKFFDEHQEELYRGTEELTEIAILRHDRSLTWRWHETYTVMELAQQMLMTAGLSWMPLWGQQLFEGTLDKYKLLVIPGTGCISREEVARISEYVQAGGRVLILENAGCYNEFHQTIKSWRFAPLFAGAAPEAGFQMKYIERGCVPCFDNQDKEIFADFGKGKVGYLPQIKKTRQAVKTYEEIGGYDGFVHLQLPENWAALPAAIEKLLDAPNAVGVNGPDELMAEFLRKDDKLLVHLLNYGKEQVGAGVEVLVAGAAGKSAQLYLPDQQQIQSCLKAQEMADGVGRFVLPAFARYALLAVGE
jgi:hypothetical protein